MESAQGLKLYFSPLSEVTTETVSILQRVAGIGALNCCVQLKEKL